MDEKTIKEHALSNFTFKARFKARKSNFMPKVVSRKVTVSDAFERHYRSSISTFIPKLSPHYTKPHVMLHVSNGASSCLVRFNEPESLITALKEIIDTLQSDKWRDAWWRLCDISEELIVNNHILLDEEMIDINAWHKALENTMDIDLVQVKKEEGGEK